MFDGTFPRSCLERRRSAVKPGAKVLSFLYCCGCELDWNWTVLDRTLGRTRDLNGVVVCLLVVRDVFCGQLLLALLFCRVWWIDFLSVVEPFSSELLCQRATPDGLAPRVWICLRIKLFHVVFLPAVEKSNISKERILLVTQPVKSSRAWQLWRNKLFLSLRRRDCCHSVVIRYKKMLLCCVLV